MNKSTERSICYYCKKITKNLWNYVSNIDCSDTFTLICQYDQRNEDVYIESPFDILYKLKTKSKQKYQKSVMLWDSISYKRLFLKQSSIFIDELYTKLIRTIVTEQTVKELGDL
ncbi:unnamed protein product [Rotaria sordida]|uniref:Uncharacterized protein n=1 Tax=Rotaria sordida TaxID=392033 RepID=A0A819KDK0_9BILA|nr:unnamed protein product [Rotaria sordida]